VAHLRTNLLPIGILLALASYAASARGQDTWSATSLASAPGSAAYIFVADGAGDFRAASKALREAVAGEQVPLTVETFPWSHGYCRIFSDQIDHGNVKTQSRRLAQLVLAHVTTAPHVPVSLLGHSAGCAVVLAAAEDLPAGTLQRIILLAPSVPAKYDLRPALRSVRAGMDVFSSPKDNLYLRVGMVVTNILRPNECTPAGCTGFSPDVETSEDGALYAKLTQYPWEPRLAWTGHYGGHFGCYQQTFLRVFVLPLLISPTCPGTVASRDRASADRPKPPGY